jgi:hypothetical protein
MNIVSMLGFFDNDLLRHVLLHPWHRCNTERVECSVSIRWAEVARDVAVNFPELFLFCNPASPTPVQFHLAFTFALALLCLDIAATLVLATQSLLLGIELEDFLIVLRQSIQDDLEAAVQAVDEALIVFRLIDNRREHDSSHFTKCDLSEFDNVGCGAILQHVGGTLQQCLNGRLLGLL